MKTIFDLEQKIMDCWGVVDDIKAIEEAVIDSSDFAGIEAKYADKISNLLSIHHMYQLKFEKLFNTFEECIRNPQFKDPYTDIVSDGGMDPRGFYEERRK